MKNQIKFLNDLVKIERKRQEITGTVNLIPTEINSISIAKTVISIPRSSDDDEQFLFSVNEILNLIETKRVVNGQLTVELSQILQKLGLSRSDYERYLETGTF